ncbi:MAG TPA: hypothetical protein VFU81_04815 [Thermomicrobiales bacterium]|nr:hypothetical protein [Thermomicrobiales bacterium]
MTDQQEHDQGGVATLEPAAGSEPIADGLAQTPLEPNGAEAAARRGGADRKAARELKRAERAERRPDRKDRKLSAAITPDVESDAPPIVHVDAEPVEAAPEPVDAPLAQSATLEPTSEAQAIPEAESEPAFDAVALAADAATADNDDEAPASSTTQPERNPKRAERLERKAARRGDGQAQDGAEPAPSRDDRRAERLERRAARPSKATPIGPNGAAEPTADADGADAVAGEGEAPRPPMLVKADLGAIPTLEGNAKRADRKAGRMDVQHAAAAEALSAIDPNNAAMAPLIRYVNAVSMHLNESQKTVGKLQVERDALRAQVLSLDAEPIDASRFAELAKKAGITDASDPRQQRRSERQAAKDGTDDAPASEDDAGGSMDETGRKRRLIALGALALVGLVALGTRVMNHPIDLSNMSKDSLGSLAIVGQFMQVFLAGMIFYRLARIGSRAGRWLFPENDPKMVKKQQQEVKAIQKKKRHADA